MSALLQWSSAVANAAGGASARMIEGYGRRYASGIRIVTTLPVAVVAVLAPATVGMRVAAGVAMVLVTAWSTVYVIGLRRSAASWLTVVDVTVLAGVALSSIAVVPPTWLETGKSWLLPFVSFAAMGYQFCTSLLLGAAAASVLVGAMTAGTLIAVPAGGSTASLVTATWSLVLAGLCRALYLLVRRGGARADQALADVERARSDLEVAAALRRDQLTFTTGLHDTAATTLLMVGLGQVKDRTMLSNRARRDLEVLRVGEAEAQDPASDLSEKLMRATVLLPITVQLSCRQSLAVPVAVEVGLVGAATEAVSNAARHGGVDAVEICVEDAGAGIRIEIKDRGVGFEQLAIGDARRGIRDSITGRMRQVGGKATIRSVPGVGTVVVLDWPHA